MNRNLPNRKIYCIGLNKTGTTTIEQVLRELRYTDGHQQTAESLLEYWTNRTLNRIIDYFHTADTFQDIPFSLPYSYVVLNYRFPESKFILSVRDSAEQW